MNSTYYTAKKENDLIYHQRPETNLSQPLKKSMVQLLALPEGMTRLSDEWIVRRDRVDSLSWVICGVMDSFCVACLLFVELFKLATDPFSGIVPQKAQKALDMWAVWIGYLNSLRFYRFI